MVKAFFLGVLFSCMVVHGAVSYPPEVNPHARMDKAFSKMSRRQKAEFLEKVYKFMLAQEAKQGTALVWSDPANTPDWLDTILWETANAGDTVQTVEGWEKCMDDGKPLVASDGREYPRACMFAGNIICTRTNPPKAPRCNRDNMDPSLYCDGKSKSSIKCQPIAIMKCEGNRRVGDECVNVDELLKKYPTDPPVTSTCIGSDPKGLADHVSQCVDPNALAEMAKVINLFCENVRKRDPQGKKRDPKKAYVREFAQNDKDCQAMTDYLLSISVPSSEVKEAKEVLQPEALITAHDACAGEGGFQTLCSGFDAGSCGNVTYTAKPQQGDAIVMEIEQSGVKTIERFKKGDPEKQIEHAGKGLHWLMTPAREGWDLNSLGRVGSWDESGRVLSARDGNMPLCCRPDGKGSIVFESCGKFKDYINDVVENKAQQDAIHEMIRKCGDEDVKAIKTQIEKDGKTKLSDLTQQQIEERARKLNTRYAVLKVSDTKNNRMGLRVRTGRGGQVVAGKATPDCDGKPCTDGTFVCAKVNKDAQIKDNDISHYFTLYTDRMSLGSGEGETMKERGDSKGELQFLAIGTFKNAKGESKKYPDNAKIWRAGESDSFLEIFNPKELNAKFGRLRGVAYSATEQVCPTQQMNWVNNRKENKVVGKIGADGKLEKILVCDRADGNKNGAFDVYISVLNSENMNATPNENGDVVLNNLYGFNHDDLNDRRFDLTYNSNTKKCIWKEEGAYGPTPLHFTAAGVVKGPPAPQSIRTIQSVKPQQKN